MENSQNLISTSKVAEIFGVSISTIYRWLKSNKLSEPSRTFGNHRRFNKQKILDIKTPKIRSVVLYSRVSSYTQKPDLKRQKSTLYKFAKESGFKNIIEIQDIGSGMNFKKKGIRELFKLLTNGEIDTIIIQHRDRLSRFGINIIAALAANFGTKILTTEQENKSKDELFILDIMSLLTIFSSSIHGKRSHINSKS